MDEAILTQRLAEGDKDALAEIVRRYRDMVLRAGARIVGNGADAEDVAQEVFLKLMRKARQFKGDAKVSTWLYRITVNTALNHLRRRRWLSFADILGTRQEETAPEPEFAAPDADRPDSHLERKRDRQALDTALRSLPDRQRTAFVLHRFEGLSYEQIADAMATSLSSVESLLHRARKGLQSALLTYMEER
ncbi:MAG: sigma-70 family RNA polymerase sigma factor [Chitinivibrionales bacterium]|nr:sigma-70 family RNA polymerase sigma factor [Chitinivibrionales bacterium]